MIDWFRKMMGGEQTPPPAPPPAAPPAPRVDVEDARLPVPARDAARAILSRIAALLDDKSHGALEQVMLGDLKTMRDEHLPKLLSSYIGIPTEHRKEIFKKTGRSASYLLMESLDKMKERVEAISRDLAQSEIDTFANNADFVARRYGKIDDPFA